MKITAQLKPKRALLILLGLILAAGLILTACHERQDGNAKAGQTGVNGEQLYQCSMHPNIVSDNPGVCPICAMDLQPVTKIDAKGIPGRSPVELSDQQQQLINIRLATVIQRSAEKTIRAVGVVSYDQTAVADVNARIMGWVEQLYVDKPGQRVESGEPLMAIYSPDLYSAQQEYLLSHRMGEALPTNQPPQSDELRRFAEMNRANAEGLLNSSRKRLELWGIGAEQIKALERTGQPSNTMVLNSPISGVVVEKNVFPQQMIEPGMRLYRIADLAQVWLEPEIYEYEAPLVQVGQTARVHLPAYPGVTFESEVDFIYPYVDPKTRTVRVRLVLDNPENRLKPGMYANAILESPLGEQVMVPAAAVFDTGRRSYVFTQEQPGVFVPKLVQLGPKLEAYHVVQSGLAPGEKVVIDGNFLLDSESQLKAAAVGSLETDESAADFAVDHAAATPLPASASPFFSAILTNYLAIGKLLAEDTLAGVQPMVQDLAIQVEELIEAGIEPPENQEPFREQLALLAEKTRRFDTSNLEAARIAYGELSQALITLTAHFTPPLEQTLYVAECPMWEQSPPRWIQISEQLENPFMGQRMLQCGEVVNVISNVDEGEQPQEARP